MKAKKTSSEIQRDSELYFLINCNVYGLPKPDKEIKFLDTRRFRFDYGFRAQKVAVEVEGGVWIQGRHTRGAGYVKDMEKYNLATLEGWKVLRFTPQQLKKAETYLMIKKLLEREIGE